MVRRQAREKIAASREDIEARADTVVRQAVPSGKGLHRDLGCKEAKAFDDLLHVGVVARNMQMHGGLRRLEQAGQP